MPIDRNGNWYPSLTRKQIDVFNCTKRYLLVSGPRKSGKTIAVLHRLVRHLWETPNARVGFFNRTIPNAKGGGVWDDLVQIVMPEWILANIGMSYATMDGNGVPGCKVDVTTKQVYFRINNMHGGESECRLFSLNNEDEVESKLKSTRFSMIYFSELSNFKTREVFSTSVPQLRMINLSRECHQWIADTNPSDEGEESWIYKVWYKERLVHDHPRPSFQKELCLIEMFWEDNPFLTEDDREEIRAICNYDDLLFDRYVKGIWATGGLRERHFKNYWRPAVHVVGDADHPDREQWEIALPSKDCISLIGGWDLGDINPAVVLLERVDSVKDGLSYFTVLDEIVRIGEAISTEEFTFEVMEHMEALEKIIGHKVEWNHWSDEQAIKQWRAAIGGMEASLVAKASGQEIILQGAPKEPGSVRLRVNMLKRLLARNRIFVSAHCFRVREMFLELRKGKGELDYVMRSNNAHKHPFDALSYALQMELIYEIDSEASPKAGRVDGIIAVA